MDGLQERHSLFRRGALLTARSRRPPIQIFGMVFRSPQPKYPSVKHQSFRFVRNKFVRRRIEFLCRSDRVVLGASGFGWIDAGKAEPTAIRI